MNKTSKEENQMLIKDIKKNEDKIYEQNKYSKFLIQPAYKPWTYLMLLELFQNLMKQFNQI